MPLFENDRYRFYADRMEAFDVHAGIYRSSDGQTITKDGDPAYTWKRARSESLALRTPFPILDAVFALAVSETLDRVVPAGTDSLRLKGDVPGGSYYWPYYSWTPGKDLREYTRDTAQHVEWGDSILLDRLAAKGSLIRRCDIEARRLREDPVVTADALHFIRAAWTYFLVTGDRDLLARTWECMWGTIQAKEAHHRQSNGLWTGSPWSDNEGGFIDREHFVHRNNSVVSLYANTMVAGAWQALGAIAAELGKSEQAATAASRYQALRQTINAELYRPELGTYAYYLYLPTGTYVDRSEDISAGLIYLYGIADAKRALAYHARFTPTPYGYRNLDPAMPVGEAHYHGGNVWENQEGFHGWALARLDRPDDFAPFIFWHARAGLPLKEWREGTIRPATGEMHTIFKHVLWGSLGYTSYWTRGVFGLQYEPDGLRFDPCVPLQFGESFEAELRNVHYREANLTIKLSGSGVVLKRLLLDGAAVDLIPKDLRGPHRVALEMAD